MKLSLQLFLLMCLAVCLDLFAAQVVLDQVMPALAGAGPAVGPTITLDPDPATIPGCETIQVDVWINDVTDLYGVDVRLSFNPALLEVVDADSGALGVQIEPLDVFLSPDYVLKREADNTAGTLWYAVTQLNPADSVAGSGPVVRIYFRAVGAGSSSSSVEFTYTKLSSREGEAITALPESGLVGATEPAQPALSITRLDKTTARLSWTASSGVAGYHLYHDTDPYFVPPGSGSVLSTIGLSFDDISALGDPSTNYYWVVRSACEHDFESADSNRVGEFDFAIVPGSGP